MNHLAPFSKSTYVKARLISNEFSLISELSQIVTMMSHTHDIDPLSLSCEKIVMLNAIITKRCRHQSPTQKKLSARIAYSQKR